MNTLCIALSYYEKFEDEGENCINEEIPFKLPNGWEYCRLCDITKKEIKRGKAPKYADDSGTIVFAQKCNRKTGNIDLSLAQYLDESILGKYPEEEYMLVNDIVINSTGTGTLGRVGFFKGEDSNAICRIVPDSHVTTIRVSSYIHPMYAYIFLKHLQPYLETHGEGSTNQKELKPATLKNLLVPIPSFSEQCRIVQIVKATLISLSEIEDTLI